MCPKHVIKILRAVNHDKGGSHASTDYEKHFIFMLFIMFFMYIVNTLRILEIYHVLGYLFLLMAKKA